MSAPKHLGSAGRSLWRAVSSEYDLDGAERAILQAAAEAADRVAEARAAVERDGAFIAGRYGPRAHPAVAVERDSRVAMLRALRDLGLERPGELAPRPGGVTSFPRGGRRAT